MNASPQSLKFAVPFLLLSSMGSRLDWATSFTTAPPPGVVDLAEYVAQTSVLEGGGDNPVTAAVYDLPGRRSAAEGERIMTARNGIPHADGAWKLAVIDHIDGPSEN